MQFHNELLMALKETVLKRESMYWGSAMCNKRLHRTQHVEMKKGEGEYVGVSGGPLIIEFPTC